MTHVVPPSVAHFTRRKHEKCARIGSRSLGVPTNTAKSAHSCFTDRPFSNEYPAQLIYLPSASNGLEKRIMSINKSHLRCGIEVRYQLTQVAETARAKRSSGGPK